MIWDALATSKIIENLGWTLVSSIWQISLIALVLLMILRVFKNVSASARCFLAISALSLAFVLPFISFIYLTNFSTENHSPEKADVNQSFDLPNEKLHQQNLFRFRRLTRYKHQA